MTPLTSPALPSYITYTTYPTLTFGPSTALTLGTSPSITYNWYVQGLSIITGKVPVFSPLTVNIYHECFTQSVTNTVASSFIY